MTSGRDYYLLACLFFCLQNRFLPAVHSQVRYEATWLGRFSLNPGKQHKPPTSRADCVNCGTPSHSQVTGLFCRPPNVRSLHMTRRDHGTVGCLLYVYAGSFRSSCLYVTTSYYFPVNHFPLFFFFASHFERAV